MTMLDRQTAALGIDEAGDQLLVDVDPSIAELVFRIGKHRVRVSKSDLWNFCYLIGDEETQERLTPVRHTEVMHYEKVHTIKLKRDLKKGDVVRTRCIISVPLTVVEGLKGMLKPKEASQIILPPTA